MGIYLLPHSIETAADRDGDHIAFRAGNADLTFAELARKQSLIAAWLVDTHLVRGGRVGVYCRRSLESAMAVYGVMQAGGAFVPIDPDAAPGWLESVVRDCGLNHLICDPNTEESARRLLDELKLPIRHVLGIDHTDTAVYRGVTWESIEQYSGRGRRIPRVLETDLAYIMYTSGSTGPPKGIMHTHGSGLSYARLSSELYGLRPEDRIANHSPLHFDMSTLGYLTAPFVGATAIMVSEAHTKFPASLSALIQKERVSIWYSVPTALIQLLLYGALDKRDCESLRWVLYGGESFVWQHLRNLMELWPYARFSNVYGPAEVNQCTYFHFSRKDLEGLDSTSGVPLGREWENTDTVVLDEDGIPVHGAVERGELAVCSSTMMKGYWNRPEQTEAAFIAVGDQSGTARLYYRCGDLVKRDPDGTLHFLGRKDRQVKVRGYRIELDGVETVLTGHAAVQEGAVYLSSAGKESNDSKPELSVEAAVTLQDGESVTSQELVAFLKANLPPYAVAQRIRILKKLPRTGSGKIDRTALAAFAGYLQASM